ncbi:MAG: hypothetical protein NVS1B9_11720 [Solirubrobacteraceae bacterium]
MRQTRAAAAPIAEHQPSDHEELVAFLERDQLVADTSRPVAPAELGWRARSALWALRAFVVVVSAMVIYTFSHAL